MNHTPPPLLIVVIMVKNESQSIVNTLLPFVTSSIKHFFVFDTGSTDDTVDVVKNFFETHQLTGKVQQETFIDFSTSRNRALELAENFFPTASFIIMPDSEWYLQNGNALLTFLEGQKSTSTEAFLIKLKSKSLEFYSVRVFRASAKVRFKGVVHEVPNISTKSLVPSSVYFKWDPSNQGKEKSKLRWQRDAQLLLQEHEKNPEDARTAFYLAQTYDCLEELETALKYYQKREKINGWEEENFMTLFRIGSVLERLSKKENSNYTWEMAMSYYLKAFGTRPTRVEPLVKIADHYWPHNIPACYLYAMYAYNLPKTNDILFVEKEMYDYTRYEILSRCAWYMQNFRVGKDATKRALKIYPHMEHLKRNLNLYEKQV